MSAAANYKIPTKVIKVSGGELRPFQTKAKIVAPLTNIVIRNQTTLLNAVKAGIIVPENLEGDAQAGYSRAETQQQLSQSEAKALNDVFRASVLGRYIAKLGEAAQERRLTVPKNALSLHFLKQTKSGGEQLIVLGGWSGSGGMTTSDMRPMQALGLGGLAESALHGSRLKFSDGAVWVAEQDEFFESEYDGDYLVTPISPVLRDGKTTTAWANAARSTDEILDQAFEGNGPDFAFVRSARHVTYAAIERAGLGYNARFGGFVRDHTDRPLRSVSLEVTSIPFADGPA